MPQNQLNTLKTIIKDTMRVDQFQFNNRVRQLQKKLDIQRFEKLAVDIETSLKKRQQRLQNLPQPEFTDDLPISEHRDEIAQLIRDNQVVIIAGETGSGKTTQIPKICIELQRGVSGLIGCTQPRRIAARTIADRVASELKTPLGHAVGYKVRFTDRISEQSYIKFMTDGILLAETQNDKFLEQYDTLIIDEAHERSLNIDFLLGYLKNILPKRPDLKVIITSATIDTERFSQHFNDAPILEVSGRTYPVELRYRPLNTQDEDEQDRDMQQAIIDAVDEISRYNHNADILIFLSGERDIRETTESLRKHKLQNTEVLALYARLSNSEQNKVFNPSSQRRIILTTNVAETSLTVPRIKAVIDTGLARISRYSVRSKVQRLPIEKIAQSSANQRKGRCGRIAEGLCVRLYSEEDFNQRPEFTEPEILRTSLASVTLQMLALRLGNIEDFPFVEPPNQKMVNDGYNLLIELGAVDNERKITETGRQLAKMPIDPRIARMILAAKQEGCLHEVLVIASALSIQDPRERPMDAQDAADNAQRQFKDEHSDFLSFIKLWDFHQNNAKHLSQNKLRKLCHEHFLSYLRMREWFDVHHQLANLVKQWGWHPNEPKAIFELEKAEFTAIYDAVHRALLSGLLGNIAYKSKEEHYQGARNTRLFVFPGSGLFKKPSKWIMSAELVETSKLFARCVAKIQPEWVEKLAGHLCQKFYFEPHWEKKASQVAAFEKVTLYGLTIVPKRKINFGAIDPEVSHELFLRQALVAGDFYSKAPFFKHNQQLFNDIERMEHKARRQDILVDDETVYQFYAERIPEYIYSGHGFEKWRKQAEMDNPQLLFLTEQILMTPMADIVTEQSFPDFMFINEIELAFSYHFETGHERDGVTVNVPLPLLNQLRAESFEWLVLGLVEEKITALLKSLPKPLRKSFVPVPDVAKAAFCELKDKYYQESSNSFKDGLYNTLLHFLHRRKGSPLPNDAFDIIRLPDYLFMNFRLIGVDNEILATSRDLAALQKQWGNYASQQSQQKIADTSGLERKNLKRWDFGDLPDSVNLVVNEVAVQGFPTFIDQETHVDLTVLDNPDLAQQHFYTGLRRLFLLNIAAKRLVKQMPISHQMCLRYMSLGNSDQLKQDVLIAAVDAVFLHEPLPRTQADFDKRLSEGNKQLMTTANDYARYLEQTLSAYHDVILALNNTKRSSRNVTEIRQHLHSLVYSGFVQKTPLANMKHCPRYVKALGLRLQKLEQMPAKDDVKATQIRPFWENYRKMLEKTQNPSQALLDFRWTLEELNVAIFAQELKTPQPISIQRVEKMWKALVS
ncbi:ATP-dependent RNA helicase HrpA [Candidatus Albibeggiatoa sp. nov. BB20]|uniref:ATP-dependent RNA helicase HrpA n=1 Tax=Candidatus Albibeggiatoa sp. nov. BB20 TaxID=3162723 RepID=UPI0033657DB8